MNGKRSNFVVSVGLFYKRPFSIEDIGEINPDWIQHRYEVQRVLDRLVLNNYLTVTSTGCRVTPNGYRVTDNKYLLTEFGRQKAIEHASWRRLTGRLQVGD